MSSPESLFAEKQREDAIRARRTVMHRYVDRHLRDPRSAFTRLCHGFPRSVLDHLKPVAAFRRQLPSLGISSGWQMVAVPVSFALSFVFQLEVTVRRFVAPASVEVDPALQTV
ncbi:hypothetical protein [Georgenia sp. SUBG003]|uniref:hypothetical protein n=1 Tax=Georgenia sp. SUBG003 TaxID=1497974 RepID=UPI003AB55732